MSGDEWVECEICGVGAVRYPNGVFMYEASMECGRLNGTGAFRYVNGDVYDGDWQDDKRMARAPTDMR